MIKIMLVFNLFSSILCFGLFLFVESSFRYLFLFNALTFLACAKTNIDTIRIEKQTERLEKIRKKLLEN